MSYGGAIAVKSDEKYEVEDAARTLIRAAEIRQDKKLFPKVQKELAKQAEAAQAAAAEAKAAKGLKKVFGS